MLTTETLFRDFPTLEGIAYLNTAAESVPPICVTQAVSEYMHHKRLGMRGRDHHFPRVEECREVTARLLGLTPAEVSFCSCSSEAYNLLASALDLQAGDEVVLSDLDFPAGATPWLTARDKPMTKVWQAKAGQLELDDLLPLLNENTKLVQLSLVSFYNGFRLPWNDVAALVRHHAPHAVLSADITQAFGRVSVQGLDADIFISSTHKWTLGIHGGGVVGIPAQSAQRLTTTAGGWYHLSNAFDADRFDRAVTKPGAASYSVGMPSFAALYALNASLRYLEKVGIANIEAHANPLLQQLEDELKTLGIQPMCSLDQSQRPTGILAFQHPRTPEIHTALEAAEVHVMHHAGRIRIAIHGYNQPEDVERLVASIAAAV
jgi:selenocysteine lyase/cysteine desulfurase